MLRIYLMLGLLVLAGCKTEDAQCLVFSPSGSWPEETMPAEGADWPFSFASIFNLQHGLTPVKFCSQLGEFDGYAAYTHADFDDRLAGLTSPLQLEFDGDPHVFGSSTSSSTDVRAFFSAPSSGSQLNSFEVSYFFFAEGDGQPLASKVLEDAIGQFGPYTATRMNDLGPMYAWIIDDGKLLARPFEGQCALDRLDRFNVSSIRALEPTSCDGFLELRISSNEADPNRANLATFIAEDRLRIVQSVLIDDAAAALLGEK